MDLNEIVKKMVDSQFGFILTKEGEPLNTLAATTTWKDRVGLYGNDMHITCHIFPLFYSSTPHVTGITASRVNAIYNIFARWTDAGNNKKHVKSPFACKAFQKYLDEIKFAKADYMVMLVE